MRLLHRVWVANAARLRLKSVRRKPLARSHDARCHVERIWGVIGHVNVGAKFRFVSDRRMKNNKTQHQSLQFILLKQVEQPTPGYKEKKGENKKR